MVSEAFGAARRGSVSHTNTIPIDSLSHTTYARIARQMQENGADHAQIVRTAIPEPHIVAQTLDGVETDRDTLYTYRDTTYVVYDSPQVQ